MYPPIIFFKVHIDKGLKIKKIMELTETNLLFRSSKTWIIHLEELNYENRKFLQQINGNFFSFDCSFHNWMYFPSKNIHENIQEKKATATFKISLSQAMFSLFLSGIESKTCKLTLHLMMKLIYSFYNSLLKI